MNPGKNVTLFPCLIKAFCLEQNRYLWLMISSKDLDVSQTQAPAHLVLADGRALLPLVALHGKTSKEVTKSPLKDQKRKRKDMRRKEDTLTPDTDSNLGGGLSMRIGCHSTVYSRISNCTSAIKKQHYFTM